jgi:response regulator RpfG family c-di-GMP phosphodiesterase
MFKKSAEKSQLTKAQPGWKILIVDDEPDIHTITKIALSNFKFDNKGLQFLNAYSGEEAKQILSKENDIALIYLDVVMETDDAGLLLAKYIREELHNDFVRIILRTGQPGQAPERDVILNYDINDYKEKTSLSSDKLFTSTLAGLRGYRDIISVENSRKRLESHRIGLEKIIQSSANLFRLRSLKQFASGLLVQLASILHIEQDTVLIRGNYCTVMQNNESFDILAGTGTFNDSKILPDNIINYLHKACEQESSIFMDDIYIGYFPSMNGTVNLIYLEGITEIDDLDKQLLEVFSNNITIAFDNLYLDREIFETQAEIIDTLGDVVESRSKEAANHVKRVSYLSKSLATWYGLSDELSDELFMASPMHDVGKVAIPDAVLLKPGKLNEEEWKIMQSHVQIGCDIFARSKRPVLKAASIVAGQHHEKFDGTGYPNGLKGEDIHIYGRIVALVDVFDALIHARCYKAAWPLDKVLALLDEEKGRHFDPKLVDLFMTNIEEVKAIVAKYPD